MSDASHFFAQNARSLVSNRCIDEAKICRKVSFRRSSCTLQTITTTHGRQNCKPRDDWHFSDESGRFCAWLVFWQCSQTDRQTDCRCFIPARYNNNTHKCSSKRSDTVSKRLIYRRNSYRPYHVHDSPTFLFFCERWSYAEMSCSKRRYV